MAYQAIANNGILYKPNILRDIRVGDKVIHQARPLRIRRVVSASMARRVTDVLCAVVEEGSGAAASFNDVKIAGKTGTAQKVIDGKYSNSSIITTFAGYFPAAAPDYLIVLMIDEPKSGYWASTIAAPVFREVAQSIYQMNSHRYAAK